MKKTEVNLQCKKCFKSYIFLDDLIDCLFDFFLTDENAGKTRKTLPAFFIISLPTILPFRALLACCLPYSSDLS